MSKASRTVKKAGMCPRGGKPVLGLPRRVKQDKGRLLEAIRHNPSPTPRSE